MASFCSLPLEIRILIYKYCLCTEIEIYPHPAPYEVEKPAYKRSKSLYPSPALCAVNKQIRPEACAILYGENQWRFNGAYLYKRKFDEDTRVNGVLSYACQFLSNVTIVLNQRDISEETRQAMCRTVHAMPEKKFNVKNVAAAKARSIHGRLLQVHNIWCGAYSDFIKNLPNLQTLTLDLQHFYCPAGCCRLKIMESGSGLWHCVVHEFLKTADPEWTSTFWAIKPKLFVTGLLNEDERELFYETYGFSAPEFEKEEESESEEEEESESEEE